MLPKSRIVSALVFGVGLACITWGILFPVLVVHGPRLPLDIPATTLVLKDPNAHMRTLSGENYHGGVEKQFHISIIPPTDDAVATARIGATTLRDDRTRPEAENLAQAEVWTYTFDRTTGENTTPLMVSEQLASPAKEVDFHGLWVKFPAYVEQTNYELFDATLRRTVPAVFREEQLRNGRSEYIFVQKIPPTNVHQNNPSVFSLAVVATEDGGLEQAELIHQGQRELHVDRITGLVTHVSEEWDDYYQNERGERVDDALQFTAQSSEEFRQQMDAEIAKISDGSTPRLISWIILGFGIVLAVLGAFMALRPQGRKQRGTTIDASGV
ncbi:MAG: DUF3068 domain-containing protein [Corynebacterium sp.]|uniref:DUF3068 domain-containing protein n=1 Tax=Corynebacterium sp. TaxID=1720 RepID=UPI0026DBCC0C|nr:DUF3068 domain-containing protein [Corynebacterium sp.]MDO4761143.1 DUF3068 domain-containing protein [Corynebacterium sp.]